MASLKRYNKSQNEGRNTFVRILMAVIGVILMVSGLILTIATVGITLDGDPSILVLIPTDISMMIGGGYVFAKQFMNTPGAEALPEPDIASVLSLPQQTSDARDESATQGKADSQQGEQKAKDDVTSLIIRSTDVFATMRDLVRHEESATHRSDKHHLASMLKAAGIMSWGDAPTCEAGRLSRTEHFWVRQNTDDLTDEQYDTLIAAEAALNINQKLPAVRSLGCDDDEALRAKTQLMRDMCDQTIPRPQLTEEGLRVCYHTTNADETPQEWVVRSTVCNAAECLKTAFRVVYDLRADVEHGLVVLGIETPRPACMAIYTPDTQQQASLARAYAFRLAYLLARHALDCSSKVTRVVVNGHEHASQDTNLSIEFNRSNIATMEKVAKGERIERAFPTDECIRASFEGSWFAQVEPFVGLDDKQAIPALATVFPELDMREAPQAVAQTCHAKRICDLGINENAVRIKAWNDVREAMSGTTEQAVQALVAKRNAADDITVAEACNRVVEALVDGKVDLDDTQRLASMFIDGSALDVASRRAAELLDGPDGSEDPEGALKILEPALAPFEDMGVYLDDETCVYRYFGSIAERIHHNAVIDEGGREIKLVPDSYFNAHSNASIALGMLERYDEALAHADICMRIAPTSTYATMRKVRILEAQSRIYEAADLIISVLRHAVTPRDASISLYRLAYMEWKLGREDLAAACYVRSMSWDTDIAGQAREELNDLLEAVPNLQRPTDEQADALLAREGIPLGCVRTDGEHTLAAAVACMDAQTFLPASPLTAVLFGMNGDDVVMGVYRSLRVSV